MDTYDTIKHLPTDIQRLREVASQQISLFHYERIHRAATEIVDLRMKLAHLIEATNNCHLWSDVNRIIETINTWPK